MTDLLLADPDGIRLAAARLAAAATAVRDEAHHLGRSAAPAHWRGPAARDFHLRLRHEVLALLAVAGQLEEVTGAMRAYATAVAERAEGVARAERAALDRVGHWLLDGLGTGGLR